MSNQAYQLHAADQACTARLQHVADTLAAFHAAAQEKLARGERVPVRMLRAVHDNAREALQEARRQRRPLELEFFAAIEALQTQEEAVRELLP